MAAFYYTAHQQYKSKNNWYPYGDIISSGYPGISRLWWYTERNMKGRCLLPIVELGWLHNYECQKLHLAFTSVTTPLIRIFSCMNIDIFYRWNYFKMHLTEWFRKSFRRDISALQVQFLRVTIVTRIFFFSPKRILKFRFLEPTLMLSRFNFFSREYQQ